MYNTTSYLTLRVLLCMCVLPASVNCLMMVCMWRQNLRVVLQVVEIYPYAKDCTPFDTSVECRDYVKIVNSNKN